MRIAGPALLIDDDPVANRQTGIACQIDRRNNADAHHNRVASNLSSVRQIDRRDPPILADYQSIDADAKASVHAPRAVLPTAPSRSESHTSELPSLMRTSHAVFD